MGQDMGEIGRDERFKNSYEGVLQGHIFMEAAAISKKVNHFRRALDQRNPDCCNAAKH